MQSCFTIAAQDPDVGQSTTISLNGSISGLSFTHTGGASDTATICWTPTLSDSLNNPNCFTLEVTDDACPFIANQIRTYCINVSLIDEVATNKFQSFNVSPNPFNNELLLSTDQFSNFEIILFDLAGRIVYSENVQGKNHKINTSNLESGIYLITVKDQQSGLTRYKKVICHH